MTPALSVYLNLLRFCAAFAVYLFHAQHFAKAAFPLAGQLGEEAVIAFFVLSGMLITFSGMEQPDLGAFMSARLARLWSVCLPALALTCIVDLAGQYLAMASYAPMQPYSAFKWAVSLGINALFLNQLWNLGVYPGTNGPFWSLSYEFWYYVLFAGFMYFKGKKRVLVLAACALLTGPLILSAFPIWLMGVFLYFAIQRVAGGAATVRGWLLWGGSFVLAWLFAELHVHDTLVSLFPGLAAWARWSVNFMPASYLVGLLVMANIYGFAVLGRTGLHALLGRHAGLINRGADISFGLYLFHYPLMYFARAVMTAAGIEDGAFFIAAIYVLPFMASATLASYCEKQKGVYSSALRKIFTGAEAYYRSGRRRSARPARAGIGQELHVRMHSSASLAHEIHSEKL